MNAQFAPWVVVAVFATMLLMSGRAAASDRQIRPFIGATFAGQAPLDIDVQGAAEKTHPAIGVGAVFLGELFGAEIDVSDVPGFFEAGDQRLVLHSRVTTVTGNVVLAAPRRLTEYAVRPYFVAGGGLMRVSSTTALHVFDVSSVKPVFDIGVGALAFVTNRAGVCGDVRRFQSFHDEPTGGLVDHISFWRATLAVVIRY